jgi:4-hydroxy-tetrahydrodipicolinate synthase
MLRPPTFQPAGADQIIAYYKAVSDAVPLPIFIQDTPSTPVSGTLARSIAQECKWVHYIKVESMPPSHRVKQAVDQVGDVLGVFGGAGGNYFIEEMRRGSTGTMPGCYQPRAFVQVWDAFQRGDEQAARDTFYREILPINRLIGAEPGAFYNVSKEILRQRGIIRTSKVRGPLAPLSETTRQELQATCDMLYGSTN